MSEVGSGEYVGGTGHDGMGRTDDAEPGYVHGAQAEPEPAIDDERGRAERVADDKLLDARDDLSCGMSAVVRYMVQA